MSLSDPDPPVSVQTRVLHSASPSPTAGQTPSPGSESEQAPAPSSVTRRIDMPSFAPDSHCDSADTVELGELLLRSATLLEAAMADCTAGFGLNETRFRVLDALRQQAPEGCSQIELAECLFLSEANLSTLLERMRLDGLLTRERSALDRRKSLVRLTSLGDSILEKSTRIRTAVLSNLMGMFRGPATPHLIKSFKELTGVLERCLAEQRSGDRQTGRAFGVVWPEADSSS